MALMAAPLGAPARFRASVKHLSQRQPSLCLRGRCARSATDRQQGAGVLPLRPHPTNRLRGITRAVSEKNSDVKTEAKDDLSTADEVTNKYGLEAGLWSVLRSQDSNEAKGMTAKELLTRYGSALLSKVGLDLGDKGGKVGTVAIAYAAHKAASPIRFPPTVALTPLVAKAIGKNKEEHEDEGKESPDN